MLHDFYLLTKYRYPIDIAIFWQYRIDIVSNSKNQYRCITNDVGHIIYVQFIVSATLHKKTRPWVHYNFNTPIIEDRKIHITGGSS